MVNKMMIHQDHFIDSGLLTRILDLIISEGGDYEIDRFDIGKLSDQKSMLRLLLKADNEERLDDVATKLHALGMRGEEGNEAQWETVSVDKAAPENFYSTTNHRSEVFFGGKWRQVRNQRMDASIVWREDGPECVKLRDLVVGDSVLTGTASVRVYPPEVHGDDDVFAFMSNNVSSERNATKAAEKVARMMKDIRDTQGRIIAVAGPVVVHTGGADALASLVRDGWVDGFLGGNAIAVHDLEFQLYGTSLGVDTVSGLPAQGGHKNHMEAINTVYTHGSIQGMMREGKLASGIMYEIITSRIPYCLAGSIRDDGPLPETEMDMIKAQGKYAEIIAGADMIIMLSSMLHSIGTGNMTPSWVKTVCVDINPAVVTKLSDRGSSQAIGIVSDVGFFLRSLEQALMP
ncbi:MAG: TIGR00300 family protein [spirochete symbiont of Stewartia floridana]|nr:MAG: TIGR00300 family protein [spirochete symbiont of Stewartia floridana]